MTAPKSIEVLTPIQSTADYTTLWGLLFLIAVSSLILVFFIIRRWGKK